MHYWRIQYANFLVANANALLNTHYILGTILHILGTILRLGISFFTFEQKSYGLYFSNTPSKQVSR
jgi:hypothetical protein